MTLMGLRLSFDALMLAFFAFAFYQSLQFLPLAQTLPRTAAGAGVILTGLLLLRDSYSAMQVRRDSARVLPEEDITASLNQAAHEGSLAPVLRGFAVHMAWILGFLLLAFLFSLPVGSFIYIVLFLKFQSEMSIRSAIVGAFFTIVAMYVLRTFMDLGMPGSVWNPLGTWF